MYMIAENDLDQFLELKNSFNILQFTPTIQDHLFSVIASVLHFGNISFSSHNVTSDNKK